MTLDNSLQKTIRVSFYLLFIIIPLIFTPWNYELFEFNKMIAVYGLTTIITGAWLGRMILAKKILIKRTPFDLPLLLFLASQFTSSLLSIDRHTSFWGYYSRFHGGLLSTICYLLLYWAFVSNMDYKSTLRTLYSALGTAAFVAAYGIAEHYGIDAKYWVQDVRTRVFSSLGQPNWLAAYLAILIPIVLGLLLNLNIKTPNNFKFKISNLKFFFYLCLYLLLTLCFFYTRSQSGLFGLGTALVIFGAGLIFINLKQKIFDFKNLALFFLIISFIFIFSFNQVGLDAFPQISNFVQELGLTRTSSSQTQVSNTPTTPAPLVPDISSPTGEIRKIVWKGAIEIWKHYPIFGSGVETFAYSYYNFRPIEHNLVSEWDFLYNKAHNEYLNFLATTGLVGLGTYLIFITCFIIWSLNQFKIQNLKFKITIQNLKFKKDKEKLLIDNFNFELLTLNFTLFSGWLSILITNFFGFSVVPVALFFFLIPAFCVVLMESVIGPQSSAVSHQSSAISRRSSDFKLSQKLSLIVSLIAEGWLLLTVLNLWRADFHYAKSDKLNKSGRYDLAFGELMKAIELNKNEPVYRNEIADSAVNLALFAIQQKDATSTANLVQIALAQSEEALKVSPRNLNFRKGQVKVLYALAQINKNYYPLVFQSLQEAIKLAPTDPKLLYNLGVIYGSANQPNLAVDALKKAVDLKSNYKEARYALAIYLKQQDHNEEAKSQLEYILKNLDPENSQSAKLLKEINQ